MLGCDTLRADRVDAMRNGEPLMPNVKALAERGALFENCYVPCGRTAPSLVSLLSGTWPHTHGIRDNYVPKTTLNVPLLPHTLADAGYRTLAVSDWCGADFGKFDLGFQVCDLPEDSWNLRHLIRQGPKDLRLFLSLFVRNRFGKRFLPELYYLGGVPSTDLLGRDVRHHLSKLAGAGEPFFLNAFFSTTHPPFASEHPHYTRFADPAYDGPSKFAMARLTDPFEILRTQGEPRKEFDLDQILALYDGCVTRFDDEVGRILDHLESCGLASNTIVVLYSDHGMEFFEHGTWGQGNSVIGEQSARVPLIISDPRIDTTTRVSSIVRSVDVAPTLLDLAGLPVPADMEGTSLATGLRGEELPELAAFNESGIWLTDLPGMPADHLRYPGLMELLDVPDHESATLEIKACYQERVIEAKDRMIRVGRWKLTYQPLHSGARYCLFDLEADPACSVDVADINPEIVANLRSRLLDLDQGHHFMNLGDTIRGGVRWVVAGKVGHEFLHFGLSIVLARLLMPSDFGLLVTVQIFTGVAGFIAGGGMGQALIQSRDIAPRDTHVVFTTQLLVCCTIYTRFFLQYRLLFADWFDEPLYEDLLRVSALTFLIRPFANVPNSLLHREMRYKAKAFINLGVLLSTGITSISLALLGFGVWSLVLGGIAGGLMNVLLATITSGWRPRLALDLTVLKQFANYGVKVSMNDIVVYLRKQSGNFTVSRFIGTEAVGLFNKAASLNDKPRGL